MLKTPRKIAANQANAAKSTGPRTEEGKEVVAQNGVTHGLRSKSIVAPWEDQEEFDRFAEEMLACLAPSDPLERMMAERIVAEAWRARRAEAYEAQVMTAELAFQESDRAMYGYKYKGQPTPSVGMMVRSLLSAGTLTRLSSYQGRIDNSLLRFLRTFERLVTTRSPAKPTNPAGK
jgi:hypothetical protein